jgi:hypothetical protein
VARCCLSPSHTREHVDVEREYQMICLSRLREREREGTQECVATNQSRTTHTNRLQHRALSTMLHPSEHVHPDQAPGVAQLSRGLPCSTSSLVAVLTLGVVCLFVCVWRGRVCVLVWWVGFSLHT